MSFYISKSKIQGVGVFAKTDIMPNQIIDTIATKINGQWVINDHFGKWVNHSKSYRNSYVALERKKYVLKALVFIKRHDEITADYTDRTTPLCFKRPDFDVKEVKPEGFRVPKGSYSNFKQKTIR